MPSYSHETVPVESLPHAGLADLDLADIETPKIVTCAVEGLLEPADLARLVDGSYQREAEASAASGSASVDRATRGAGGSGSTAPPSIPARRDDLSLDNMNPQRIREKHHAVARMLAAGAPQRIVAEHSGYTSSYFSVLVNSPAMVELISHYRAAAGNAAQLLGERLRSVGMQAVERLEEKILADELKPEALIAAAKLGLDRSGHGPSQTISTTTEHTISAETLTRLNREARAASRDRIQSAKIIEGKAQRILPSPDDEA